MDINTLVKSAKKGDGDAFWELVQPRKDALYRIAYCYTKNEDDALDIVSEAICKALSSIGSLKKAEYFYTWLTRILINYSINHTRKVKQLLYDTDDISNKAEPEGLDKAEKIDLYHAIDRLDQKHKSIIILKYIEDFTIVQIAETMKMPSSTVKTYLYRALKELRMDLGEVYL